MRTCDCLTWYERETVCCMNMWLINVIEIIKEYHLIRTFLLKGYYMIEIESHNGILLM